MLDSPVVRLVIFGALSVALAACDVRMAIADGTWTAECTAMSDADCQGVATLFVGNLAWSETLVREEAGGVVRIRPAVCPALPEWAEPGVCWRAVAPTTITARACMLIARQKPPQLSGPFGQVGGDRFTGQFGAPEPGTTPC